VYVIALNIINAVQSTVDIACSVIKDDRECDKIVVGWPRPWPPMRKESINKE